MEVKIKLLPPKSVWILIIIVVLSNAYEERPPIFKSIPTTVKTRENDTVLLPCLVENLGANRVKWWRDETLVGDNGEIIVADDNLILHKNNTLEVMDVSEKDSGQYTCQVIRPQPWGPINQIHAIQVLYPPRVRLTPSGDLEVGLNEEVEVHCETKGVPPPLITWFYQGEEIPTLNQRQTLKFVANKGSLSGTYTCTASNNVGESATAELHLKVIYAPKVSIDKVLVHSAPGLKSEITCLIDAIPTPEVDWFMDNRPLRPDSKVKFTKHGMKYSLVIERTSLSDFGLYKCHAVNKIGSSYQVIQLSALANTANLRSARQEKLSDRVTLIWEVDSLSPIILYNLLFREYNRHEPARNWTKLIIPSDGSDGPIHTQMFTITGLKPSTVYEASVLSKNPYGWSRPSNVHRFATLGVDLESYFTDEDESRGNTISEYFPEYSIRKELVASKSSQLSYSIILFCFSTLRLVPIIEVFVTNY